MNIEKTALEGVYIIEPKVFYDNRGWFMESYSKIKLPQLGVKFVQDNHSFSLEKGTLRGIHFQKEPYAQAKLVRCIAGEIIDYAVDLRKDSPTYKDWTGVKLSAKNKKMLFIPKGFGHGFLTLDNNTEVLYKVDNYYDHECERSIRFDDPDLGIVWELKSPILSEKDSSALLLKDCDCDF